jgi:hypothetical protein
VTLNTLARVTNHRLFPHLPLSCACGVFPESSSSLKIQPPLTPYS